MHIMDTTHLNALELALSNERIRLANATTESEKKLRSVWITQMEKEIEGEKKFLNEQPTHDVDTDMTDAELLRELLDT
jgi:hypothetical protein